MSPSEIKGIRLALGFTQREMAHYLSITERQYQKWEAGEWLGLPRRPAFVLMKLMAWKGRKWVEHNWWRFQ